MERELFEPVRLCGADGKLNPAAVGWSRRPLVDCNLRGRWPRKKRWDYYCVTTDTHLLTLTYADVDYLGLADLWFLEYATGCTYHHPVVVPGALGMGAQPSRVGESRLRLRRFGLELGIEDEPGRTRLTFASRKLGRERLRGEIVLGLPESSETLNVVVPWDPRHFQFTSKHQCRPARGRLALGGRELRFDADNGAFGCLDFGRGIWPYRTTWNWASASGRQGGRTIGLNLGGRWTDASPTNENAVVLDGRLHKISERVAFDYDASRFTGPWRLRSPSGAIDLCFTPFHERAASINLGLLRSEVHQCFGHFDGAIAVGGSQYSVSDLLGWAEEHRARW